MQEITAPSEVAGRHVSVNDILVTPIRVDGKKVGTHYDMTPDSNWKDINKFDQATQVKKTDGSSDALSDYLLKNVKTITELAYKNGYITEDDINRKDILKDKDSNPTGSERTPLSFLEIKKNKLIIPDILSPQQTQELTFLIYGKTVNNADRDPNSRKQPEVLIEDIQKAMSNFSEDGKVDKSAKLILDTQSPQTVLRALNISLRKSVENAIKASTYSTTKDLERKGENATKRLLQRLEIGAQVKDEVDGPTIKKVIEGEMGVFTDKNSESRELEQTVQYDLLMAQAFDVLVPPDARLEMEQAEVAISKEQNYMEKAKKQADLTKTRQIWRIAMLDYFNASKLIPSTEFSLYANDLNNNKIFSPEEQDLVHKHSKEIGQRKANLDRKSGGGFNSLNIDSVNTLKAQELLLMLKPAGTVQIPEGLTQILARAHEITEVVGDTPKEIKSKKEALIKSLMKDSGILNGLQPEKSELAKKILRDAIITKNSIDKRLRDMPNSDVDVNYATLDFASSIDSGVKGIDLLYRRGLSQSIDESDRYHGHTIVRDVNEKTHLMRKLKKGEKKGNRNGFGEDLPPGGASSRGGEASMQQEHVESTETTAPATNSDVLPAGSEDPAKATELKAEQDKWVVEMARILGVKETVHNLGEFIPALQRDGRLIVKFNARNIAVDGELKIPKLNIANSADLETISKMSKYLEGAKIQIDLLNLNIAQEGENTVETPLNGFNIDTLQVDVEGRAEFTTSQTHIENLTVTNGSLTLNTDKAPSFINVEGAGSMVFVYFDSQESLDNAVTKSDNALPVIINIKDKGECNFVYDNLRISSPDDGVDQNLILIKDDEDYKIVNIKHEFLEAEKAPDDQPTKAPNIVLDTTSVLGPATKGKVTQPPVGGDNGGGDKAVDFLKIMDDETQSEVKPTPAPIRPETSEPAPVKKETEESASTTRGKPVPLNIDPLVEANLKAQFEAAQNSSSSQPATPVENDLDIPAFLKNRKTGNIQPPVASSVKETPTIADDEDIPTFLRSRRVTQPVTPTPATATVPTQASAPAQPATEVSSAFNTPVLAKESDAFKKLKADQKNVASQQVKKEKEVLTENVVPEPVQEQDDLPDWLKRHIEEDDTATAPQQTSSQPESPAESAENTAKVTPPEQPTERTARTGLTNSTDSIDSTSSAFEVPEPHKKENWFTRTFPKIFGKKPVPAPPEPNAEAPLKTPTKSTPSNIAVPESDGSLNLKEDGTQYVDSIISIPDNPLFPGHALQKAMIKSGFDSKSSSLFINGLNEIISSKKFDADKLENTLGNYTFDKIKEGGYEEIISTLSQYVVEKSAIEPENNNIRSVALRMLEEITKDRYYFEKNRSILLKSSIDLAMVYTNKPEENNKAINKFLKDTGQRFGLKTEDSRFNGDELVDRVFSLAVEVEEDTNKERTDRRWKIADDCLVVFNSPDAEIFLRNVQTGIISKKANNFFSRFHTRIDSLGYEIVGSAKVKLQKKQIETGSLNSIETSASQRRSQLLEILANPALVARQLQKASFIHDPEDPNRISYIADAAYMFQNEIVGQLGGRPNNLTPDGQIIYNAAIETIAFDVAELLQLQLAENPNQDRIVKNRKNLDQFFEKNLERISRLGIELPKTFTLDSLINSLKEKFGINILEKEVPMIDKKEADDLGAWLKSLGEDASMASKLEPFSKEENEKKHGQELIDEYNDLKKAESDQRKIQNDLLFAAGIKPDEPGRKVSEEDMKQTLKILEVVEVDERYIKAKQKEEKYWVESKIVVKLATKMEEQLILRILGLTEEQYSSVVDRYTGMFASERNKVDLADLEDLAYDLFVSQQSGTHESLVSKFNNELTLFLEKAREMKEEGINLQSKNLEDFFQVHRDLLQNISVDFQGNVTFPETSPPKRIRKVAGK